MAYPLVGDDKTFDGAIILIFDLDVMRAILQRSGLPGDTNYVLVDHQGIVISRGREAGQVVGKPVTPEAMKQMLEGPDSKTTSFVRQGDKRVVSYRKLWLQGEESPYLYVRVGISTVQVLGRANRQMIFTLSMLSSCILVAFMLAVWTGKRSIADKVEALRDASQKIAAGDLTVRIAHRIEGGELGELAHSFDEMAISLSKSNEERTRHERELSQYADIVTNMQVGLYVYQLESRDDDRSLRLVAANPRASGLLGLTEHDLVGRTIDDIFPNLRQAGIPGKFAEVVRTGQSLAVDDFVYTDQNVGEAAFAFKVFPLPDNCVGVLFEDISPRKKAETSLHELNKELEQRVAQRTMELNTLNAELAAFNYSVSHDMRAPLIRIKGYADVLLETGAPKLSEEESYYLSRLKAAIDRLDNHIEALIKLYQFTRVDFYREPVDITALSWSILSGLHDLDPDRTVAVTVADGMVTEADRVLMTGLLDNLIGNAWKYTSGKAAASIEVGVTKQEGGEVYFVRDNGVGFDMDQVENVFTPFLRLHQDDSGLGIGLASAQRIVRLHGGRIWAESREGEGATFYFTLRS
jgi:signal transduction histidine kinase/HAMP domain-containing protein